MQPRSVLKAKANGMVPPHATAQAIGLVFQGVSMILIVAGLFARHGQTSLKDKGCAWDCLDLMNSKKLMLRNTHAIRDFGATPL